MTLQTYLKNRIGELNRKDCRWAKIYRFGRWTLLIGKDYG